MTPFRKDLCSVQGTWKPAQGDGVHAEVLDQSVCTPESLRCIQKRAEQREADDRHGIAASFELCPPGIEPTARRIGREEFGESAADQDDERTDSGPKQ